MIPARNGRRHVLHVLDRMLRTETAPAGQETDLAELLALAHPMIKRRSVVFVVSDFISKPGWGRPLAMLARRHEVIAVRLYDPMELELPNIGLVVMQDAETGEQIFVDTHDTPVSQTLRRRCQAARRYFARGAGGSRRRLSRAHDR